MGTYSRLHVPIVTLDNCLGLFIFSCCFSFVMFRFFLCFSRQAQKQHMCYHDVSHCFAIVWSVSLQKYLFHHISSHFRLGSLRDRWCVVLKPPNFSGAAAPPMPSLETTLKPLLPSGRTSKKKHILSLERP